MKIYALTYYHELVRVDSNEPLDDYIGIVFRYCKHDFTVVHDHTTNTHAVFKICRESCNNSNDAIIYYANITNANACTMTLHDLYYYIISDYIH